MMSSTRQNSNQKCEQRPNDPLHQQPPQEHKKSRAVEVQHLYQDPCSTVCTWGWNNGQMLQSVENEFIENPTLIQWMNSSVISPEQIRLLATGGSHSLIVTKDGRVFSFGRNQSGQLGLGHTRDCCEEPQLIPETSFDGPVIHVACGDRHSLFVTEKGLAYVCGHAFNSQLGLGSQSAMMEPVLVDHLQHRRIVFGACGSRHSILIDSKGVMYSAGYGYYGQLGHGDHCDQIFFKRIETEWRVRQLSVREHVNIAISDDYSIYVWGGHDMSVENNECSPFSLPVFVCRNICGRRVQQVAASSKHFMCRTSDGSLYGFGFHFQNLGYSRYVKKMVLGSSSKSASRPVQAEQDIMDMKLDLSSKYVIPHETKLPELTLFKNHFVPPSDKIVNIACSCNSNYFVTESGKVYSFGTCPFGELGLGKRDVKVDYPTELAVPELKVTQIVAGNFHAFAICQ